MIVRSKLIGGISNGELALTVILVQDSFELVDAKNFSSYEAIQIPAY